MSQVRSQVQIDVPQAEIPNNEGNVNDAQDRYEPPPFVEPERSHRRENSSENVEHSKHRRRSGSSGRRRYSSSPDERSPSPKRQRRHKPTHLTVLKSDGSNFSVWVLRFVQLFVTLVLSTY